MKKVFLIICLFSISFFVSAQEIAKQKQVGLVFYNFDNFGISFKTGTNKSAWRFNTMMLTGREDEIKGDNLERKTTNFGFGLSIGKEFRVDVAKNLEMYYGADLGFNYQKSKTETETKENLLKVTSTVESKIFTPQLSLVLGMNYVINDKIVIGAEILPTLRYNIGEETEKRTGMNVLEEKRDISGFNYSLSNTSVRLTLAYRF